MNYRMTENFNTQVLVVGAGPVGLTLAMDLAWRGETLPAEPAFLIQRIRGANQSDQPAAR